MSTLRKDRQQLHVNTNQRKIGRSESSLREQECGGPRLMGGFLRAKTLRPALVEKQNVDGREQEPRHQWPCAPNTAGCREPPPLLHPLPPEPLTQPAVLSPPGPPPPALHLRSLSFQSQPWRSSHPLCFFAVPQTPHLWTDDDDSNTVTNKVLKWIQKSCDWFAAPFLSRWISLMAGGSGSPALSGKTTAPTLAFLSPANSA